RHTSFSRDWSSDVCSSDLNKLEPVSGPFAEARIFEVGTPLRSDCVLAVRLGKRWWTLDLRPGCRGPGVTFASKDLAVAQTQDEQIGRASCRGRGRRSAAAG